MSLSHLLMRARPQVEKNVVTLAGPYPAFVLFFSVSDGHRRAGVTTVTGEDFASVWRKGMQCVTRLVEKKKMTPRWLRIDWVEAAEETSWLDLHERLEATKRNYFRYGLSLDRVFKHAFLETELNGNAMLYEGATRHAVLNVGNFCRYATLRHNLDKLSFPDDGEVHVFSTRGVFVSTGSGDVYLLNGASRDAGRRDVGPLTAGQVRDLIRKASSYLASQVKPDGRFYYGWHPCFDRPIDTYNSLRHASTVFAMLDAWEATRDLQLKDAIDRAIEYLTNVLIKDVDVDGKSAAFLLEENGEIKLGGSAVCLLSLTKYSELMKTEKYLGLLERLAEGVLYMQDQETGKFSHVFNYPSLSLKEEFRTIYYDGEAAFGLMRLYDLSRDPRWLSAVEKAFAHFIDAKHWKAHDHWLSYCVNELTRYRPREEYYRFGLQNFAGHLDFVIERITTFPTLLELMMAAQKMLDRLDVDQTHRHLLREVDVEKFYYALHTRANYLLNGHFWPELAMFYANPAKIVGSFFIRHHAFRVRIDDVEHYVSGYAAYLKLLEKRSAVLPVGEQRIVA
ncbi:hypothetical protein ATN84_24735 [Paramesorhizobium deserti]|uniref:Mur ligase n=1 Tax=Paramesorhizobium deserti TaxID=1494590 RepID=A0A135HXJ0_9HYPH|nr:hypothetical protein [Paramesorhizobium deserti]KXF77926.1 hypothetical protein ATN84_24735 [Paramesorhizobium deserti]